MSFGDPWGTPFYTGSGTTALVPSQFHFAIQGAPFMLDTRDNTPWLAADVPVQRAQADTEADPSEATLNTEGLWRRTWQSWRNGSGQRYADRPKSDRERYWISAGIDPWGEQGLRLLPDTETSLASATAKHIVVAGTRVFVTDGNTVRYSTDGSSWSAITGTPAATALSIATDGATIYIAYGSTFGVYTVAPGATAATSFATGTASAVAYAKGRLLVVESSTADPRVYNVTAAGAITSGTLLLTVPGGSFVTGQWATEGPGAIYIAAAVGDRTRLWRTAVKSDGAALDAPVIAGQIPDGQLVRAVQDVFGAVLLLGTDDHVFVLNYAANGDVVVAGNIETTKPVYGFEPQGVPDGLAHVWYGGTDGGLNRLNLATNVAEDPAAFAPGYATDLASGAAGDVFAVVTFLGKRLFTVFGQGVFIESEDTVASGTLEVGIVGFGIGDLKNALFADVRHLPLATGDSVTVEVAADNGAYALAGVSGETGAVSETIQLGQVLAEAISLRLTLAGDPTVTMLTARAAPAPRQGIRYQFRLLLWRVVSDLQGNDVVQDALASLAFLRRLRERRTAVTVQNGIERFTGILESVSRFAPETLALEDDGTWTGMWNGTADIDIRRVEA